jgi:hypothetical protein
MNDDLTITCTRTELIEAFARWNTQAISEAWPARDDPESAADHLISLINLTAAQNAA